MIRTALCIFAFLITNTALHAEPEPLPEAESFMKAFAPGPEHEFLAAFEGKWDVEGRLRFGTDAPWEPFRAVSVFELTMDGMFLHEHTEAEQNEAWPKAYESDHFFGFDPVRRRWQIVIMHNLGAAMTIAEGSAESETMFSATSQVDMPNATGEMTPTTWRTEYEFISEDRVAHYEHIKQGAGDEYVGIEAVYVRRRPDSPILGTWIGVDRRGNTMTFVFTPDGAVRWTVATPGGDFSWDLVYRFDNASEPARLDIHGIDTGPLAGRSVYAIVEFEGANQLRLDLEPGEPGSVGESARPDRFNPEQTVVFRRQ